MGGDPAAIREAYRTRFGIESSYRQLGQVRRRTSTADGVIRLLWVAVGLLLRNARVRFGTAGGRGWTLGAACLLLLADILTDHHQRRNPGSAKESAHPPDHHRT